MVKNNKIADDISIFIADFLLAILNFVKKTFLQRKLSHLFLLFITLLTVATSINRINVSPSYENNPYGAYGAEGEETPTNDSWVERIGKILSNVEQGGRTEPEKLFKNIRTSFTDLFDNYIATTPYFLGYIETSGDKESYTVRFSPKEETTLGASTVLPTSFSYTKLSMGVVVGMLTLLVLIQVIGTMSDETYEVRNNLFVFQNIFSTVLWLILTPYILSVSILANNKLVELFLGFAGEGETLSSLLGEVFTQINSGDLLNFTLSILRPLSVLESSATLISILLVVVLLLYISIQFVMRFITLYFLAIIYPFAIMFNIHPKTKEITKRFWTTWVTQLIHQPFFVLGFVIAMNILRGSEGNLTSLLLFDGVLLFLASINMLVGRIFGDVFSAVLTNLQSALPLKLGSKAIRSGARGGYRKLASIPRSGYNSPVSPTSSFGSDRNGDYSPYKAPVSSVHKGVSDFKNVDEVMKDGTKTFMGQELLEKGFSISSATPTTGLMKISGNMYGEKTSGSISTLYTSKRDAVSEGINSESLQEYSLNDFRMMDTSNYQGLKMHNQDLHTAKTQKNFNGEVNLEQTSDAKRVIEGMKINRSYDENRGKHGVITKRIAKNAKSEDEKILKIYAYTDLLETFTKKQPD